MAVSYFLRKPVLKDFVMNENMKCLKNFGNYESFLNL